jgi:hypothetical protein
MAEARRTVTVVSAGMTIGSFRAWLPSCVVPAFPLVVVEFPVSVVLFVVLDEGLLVHPITGSARQKHKVNRIERARTRASLAFANVPEVGGDGQRGVDDAGENLKAQSFCGCKASAVVYFSASMLGKAGVGLEESSGSFSPSRD